RAAAALGAAAAAATVLLIASYSGFLRHPESAAPTQRPPSVLEWRSPTAELAKPTESILDVRLLDSRPASERGDIRGGNHAG
ncbi:MAG: hypothetical protein JO293_07755, partial [Candidatus Eremiobacteraeota bacterium]|nr:hypothetical protein [Candidatus Eremiobacteraeota bacterium]